MGWGNWAEELGCMDTVETAHFALFLYKAPRLDNLSCLIQAYNTAIGLINSWMAYPQYMPFPLLPDTADIHRIFLQYHSVDHLVPLLCHQDFRAQWNLLPPHALPPTGLPSDCPRMVPQLIPWPRTNLLSWIPTRMYTSSCGRADADQYRCSPSSIAEPSQQQSI
uniref:Uncharacterized protein n=1 Tax=Romanomermis culicivorax TaxID=13658 RepID=A0A915L703_ROMCU